MQLKLKLKIVGWIVICTLWAIIFFLLTEAVSKGKITGETEEFISYSANYQYTCSETSRSLNDCEKIAEFRSVSGSTIKPAFYINALLSSLKIPYIGDTFPIEICAEMEPIFIPHGAIIALDKKKPGIVNMESNILLYVDFVEDKPCSVIPIEQDRLMNSTLINLYILDSVVTPEPDENTINSFVGNSITYDDNENVSRIKLRIKYSNKLLSLFFVYLLSFGVSLELSALMQLIYLRWQNKLMDSYNSFKRFYKKFIKRKKKHEKFHSQKL